MKFYQEITEWKSSTPNHVYLLNDSKSRMAGYVPVASQQLIMMSEPLPFASRYRKFVPVPDQWGYVPAKSDVKTWQVIGSTGEVYTVEETANGRACSCAGFRFRGKCKHTDTVSNVL